MTLHYSATAQPTTLAADCTDSATSIQVTATTGFPAVDFVLALDYAGAGQELVLVTNVSGTTLTVTRGYDSTPTAAHVLGVVIQHVHSAEDFRLARAHEAAESGIHGAAGDVVGTTDTQALSNKDLSSGTNTFPGSLATDAEVSSAVSTHAALTATHGATGANVGTTNSQTLTNKTVALGSNTVSGTTAQFNTANTDGDFATLAGSETLTNKTLTSPLYSGDFVGAIRNLFKSGDELVALSTTFQDDDTFTFTVVANAVYLVQPLVYLSTGDGGFKAQLVVPASALVFGNSYSSQAGLSTPAAALGGALADIESGGGAATSVASLAFRVKTGGTAGSVTLQWAQKASNAANSTVKANSSWLVTRIA